jgi:hypothetical protein
MPIFLVKTTQLTERFHLVESDSETNAHTFVFSPPPGPRGYTRPATRRRKLRSIEGPDVLVEPVRRLTDEELILTGLHESGPEPSGNED